MIRFLMIGGFLGAGKTTTVLRMARHYTEQGLRVGLVTNDQATDLVDTHTLRAAGFHVGEVAGACFCCKFDELVATLQQLEVEHTPDVIICEPVGSCTDLMATVVEPLRRYYGDEFQIGPLAVLLKPEHGRRILLSAEPVGVSAAAAYIFTKQLEEADIIAINKIDKLSTEQQRSLLEATQQRFPDRPVLPLSSRNGQGFAEFTEALAETSVSSVKSMEIDYDLYAKGEAELGWLNATFELSTGANQSIPLDHTVFELLTDLAKCYHDAGADSVHTKILVADHGGNQSLANLVAADAEPELSISSGANANAVVVTINARVNVSPDVLANWVKSSMHSLCERQSWRCQQVDLQSLTPGRPQPTHRLPG